MSHDTTIHRIVRPAVQRAARTGIAPNHLTTLRLLAGIAAALAFARGGAPWDGIGGAVFLFSMMLDRADGELARRTGRCSPQGHRYDLISDCLCNAIVFTGIGVGHMPVLGMLGPALGGIAGAGIAVLFWQINVLECAEVRGYRLFGGRIVVDPDDAMVLVPVLVWFGAAVPTLGAAAAVTPAAALWLGVSGPHGGSGRARRAGHTPVLSRRHPAS